MTGRRRVERKREVCMEIKSQALVDVVEDVICDVCQSGTRVPGYGLQHGKLEAQWGYGSQHDGEHYRVHLCEPCFFRVLSGLRRERMVNGMFDDDQPFSRSEEHTSELQSLMSSSYAVFCLKENNTHAHQVKQLN